jgi:hypothetical protein
MRPQKKPTASVCQIEQLFPAEQAESQNPAADLLQARVIEAFETAIKQGMGPFNALGIILEWASTEVSRAR